MPEILITGAGIAGDTLAVFLGRAGWTVTVVEIAPALRAGGQTVDLRGDSREVLERLGLLDAALDVLIPQRGIAWIDEQEHRLAAMPVEAFGGHGLVSSEELLRTDLARILHEAAIAAGVQYRFADTIEAVRDTADDVSVRFRSGDTQSFDLLVGADGAHSRVRELCFGPEEQFRHPLGLAHAWFTLSEGPSTPHLHGWNLVHNAPGRRALAARPGHPGEQEVGLTFAADQLPPRTDRQARFELLERTFAGVGWRTREFLDAARTAPDFALDVYDQIRMPTWTSGRVVLLGDAAWCSSPLSGLGTALGLRGAAVLADALTDGAARQQERDDARQTDARQNDARQNDARQRAAALGSYEARMRPRVTEAQRLIPGRVGMVAPRGRLGIRMNAIAMRVVQWPVLSALLTNAASDRGRVAGQQREAPVASR